MTTAKSPMNPSGIMSVLGGRVTTNVAMLPNALRTNRPTRAESSIAAEVIEQLFAEVCAARRAGFVMPQLPDEATLQADYEAMMETWRENDDSYVERDVYVEGFSRGFRMALATKPGAHGSSVSEADVQSSREFLADVHNQTQLTSALSQLPHDVVTEMSRRRLLPPYAQEAIQTSDRGETSASLERPAP